METLVHKPTNRTVTVQPAASRCVQRKAVQTRFFPRVQTSLKISSPKDPAEKEADLAAKRILRIAIPDNTLGGVQLGSSNRVFGALRAEEKEKKFQRSFRSPYIARFAESGIAKGNVFRKTEGQPDISSNLAADIQSSTASGSPLPLSTRAFMEPRFRADFSNVKIHTGEKAAKLSRQLNAHAFTVSDHVFFGKDKFRPESDAGKELIAHELTHTIQQGGAVQRKEDVTVTQRSQPMVQRGIVSEVLDYFADKAYNIPGFRMFTIVIGFNPINMEKADRSGANILRAIIEFLPGGHLIVEALENHGVFQKVGAWIEQQFATLASIGAEFKASLDAFIDSLGWRDAFRLGSVWDRAKALFMNPVNRLINFAKGLFNGIIKFIKDAILRPLAKLAEGTRGYDLLKAVLGEDPITGDPVPQTADTLIGGFMKLIGQEEIWENIKKANAIPRAWAWFKGALSGLMGLVRSIPGRFIAMFQSLTIWDIVLLPKAFAKIVGVFVGIAADFISWAGGTIWSLLEIIFSVLAPAVMPYLKKAAAAFRTILKDPIRFVGNLVRAAKQGFLQFAARFLTHLKNSLIQWLTGALPGVYIPQALNLREIIKFVLSVLGLTWANIRAKLVKAVGETAVKAMETGFDIVVTLVTQGPAAAWDKIKEALADLQAMVIDAVMDFVKSKIVEAAVTKLLSMLSPAGAFIQAIIAIYNTIMFFIERLRQIAQVAMSFIDSIAAIASGVTAVAANKVETTLAGFLTLVISFLARIAGLGKVSDAVMNIINKVRAPIDRGLDLVVNWIVTTARTLGRFIIGGVGAAAARVTNWFQERRRIPLGDGATHTVNFEGSEQDPQLMLASVKKPVQTHLAEAISDTSLSQAARNRAEAALTFYTANLSPVALRTKLDQLPDNLNVFADLLRAISTATDVPMPAASPNWGGPARAAIDLLSNRTSRGGADAASGNPPGWSILTARGLTTGGARWVRMHMISAAYGGLDLDTNEIPAPTATNTGSIVRGFEQRIETTLYGADSAATVRAANRSTDRSLFKRLDVRQAVIWLETTSAGHWPAQQDAAGVQICDASTFVRSVTFKAGLHYPRDNDWAKDTRALVTASVPIEQPDFSGTYQPNINSIGEPVIARLCRIDANYAREIVAERGGTPAAQPHTSITNFNQRMRASRTNAGVQLTQEFLNMLAAVAAAAAPPANRIKWRG